MFFIESSVGNFEDFSFSTYTQTDIRLKMFSRKHRILKKEKKAEI